VGHLPQQEFGHGRVETEAALKDVGVQQTDVGARFGFAQFLVGKERFVNRLVAPLVPGIELTQPIK
jgi:hypothetical protein